MVFQVFRRVLFATCMLSYLSLSAFADSATTAKRTVTQLADGIYEIRHPDAPDGFPQGNTTVVIGDRSVLVVDSCLLPSSARQDIEQIRRWTNKPVTYVVNTHWHFDHTLGNATYAEAFPGVQIIAQRETARQIADFNPGAVLRYPTRGERFKKILDSGKGPDGKPLTDADRRDYEKSLAGLSSVVAEFKDAKQLPASIIFDRELDLDLGNRPVQIKFLGRGNTAGDTVIFLPKDKIVMAGDLLDHPVPYLFGGFPVDLETTLQNLSELDATVIVPGHGDVLHGKDCINDVLELIRSVNTEVRKEINDGKTQEESAELAPKSLDVKRWRDKFAGTDKDSQDFFDQSFAGLVKQSYTQIKMR